MNLLLENIEHLQSGGQWSGGVMINQGDGTKVWTTLVASLIQKTRPVLFSLIVTLPGVIRIQQLMAVNNVLTRIDRLLGGEGDNTNKFNDLAQLFIPDAADWCSIHILKTDGSVDRVAVAPGSIVINQSVYDWLQNDLLNDEADGLPVVLRSGKMKLVEEVSPLRRAADAGIKSYMIIPLVTHQQILGAITFVRSESQRYFNHDTAALAENLGIHIASFLEKSQLQHESNKQFAELDQRVSRSTAELQEAMTHLKQSEEMLQTLFMLNNKLNATLDVDIILDMLAQEAIKIVNGESGFAGLRTSAGMSVKKYFQQGVEITFEHTWALGEDIPGWVLKYKVPYGTSDAEKDPLIRFDLPINAGVRSVICTPILDAVGEVIAYFYIRNKLDSESFSINDQEMLLTIVPVASIAIQNALTYQQRLATVSELKESTGQYQELAANLQSVREEERTEVARELHDELGQALTAIKFDLVWLTDQLGQKDEALAQKTKDITAQVNSMIKNVRRLATELRPGMLEDLGLTASIEWQAHDFEKRSGIECKLEMPEDDLGLTKDQALGLFRIFQEALTNVARYAEAKQIKVALAKSGDLVILEMQDDGKGIKAEETTDIYSLGLLGMRERAVRLGGTFEIHGIPDQGTSLMVTVPVNRSVA
jgi:signal transduction histidine kinase